MLFDEENHIYYQGSEQYESVTTLIGRYETPFNVEEQTKAFAEKHVEKLKTSTFAEELIKKYKLTISLDEYFAEPVTPERLASWWEHAGDIGRSRGNTYHFTKEIETLFNETRLSRDYNDNITDLSKLPSGTYPELRIFNDKYKKAGTADKVIIMRPYVYIFDYKTMKDKITKLNYGKFMKPPIQYIPDAKYYHYELQLNTYGWMLEQAGFIVKKLTLLHKQFMDHEPIPDEYKLPWKSEEEQRKIKEIPLKYYSHRISNLLEYDQLNNAT